MNLSIEPISKNQVRVMYETEEIRIPVGEISRNNTKWLFHYVQGTSFLKLDAKNEMLAWVKKHIELRTLTDRMLG